VALLPNFSDRCQHRIRIGIRIVNKGGHTIGRKSREQRTARWHFSQTSQTDARTEKGLESEFSIKVVISLTEREGNRWRVSEVSRKNKKEGCYHPR
jgi:hypothetical protein